MYADNIEFISKNACSSQYNLDQLHKTCSEYEMGKNTEKSKCIVVGAKVSESKLYS